MKTISILLLLICVRTSAESIISMDEINKKVNETLIYPASSYYSDLSWITDENKPLVFENLLNRYNNPGSVAPKAIKDDAEAALARIGHEETIKRLVATLADPVSMNAAIHYVTSEVAIPYAMPLVYHGSTEDPNHYEEPGWDVYVRPVRQNAMEVVVGCIIQGGKLPLETRQWARKVADAGSIRLGNDAYVALIISWWEHNQKAIEEKRYADATWLPRYKGRPSVLDEAELAERKMDEQRRHFPWIATGATFSETARANPWHWVVLGALVAVVVGYLLRRKSKATTSRGAGL